jgi:hypothetical protein
VELALPEGMRKLRLVDALTGQASRMVDGKVRVTVPALFGTVLLSQ